VLEVIVDTLTGEYKMLRADILHDVGDSLNPAIDIGQVEGGFIQGMGWLTMEELVWNAKGKLMTNGPASYKIPAVADMPLDLRVKLVENRKNPGRHGVPFQGRGRAAVHARHRRVVRDQGRGGEPRRPRAAEHRRAGDAGAGVWGVSRCARRWL
jgi:xanthine dehydrogenase large subunit